MAQPTRHAICLLFVGTERQPSFVVERCRVPAELGPSEVLVRVRIAGICSSDLRHIAGTEKDSRVPIIPGHEAVGDVLQSKRPEIEVGDRIVFSTSDWCMNCEWCQRKLYLACTNVMKYGHHPVADGIGLNGTLSSHVVLRKGTAVVLVPQSVPDGPALLAACPLAIAISGVLKVIRCHQPALKNIKHVDASETQPTALVQGCGLLGILTCAVLVENGFKVFCMDPNVTRLQLATKFYAEPVFKESGPLTPASVLPSQLDLVVSACGSRRGSCDKPLSFTNSLSSSPLLSSTSSASFLESHAAPLRPGGTLLLLGHSSLSASIPVATISKKGLCVIGASEYEPKHLVDAVDFLSATVGKYPYNELLSPIYGLLDFQNALTSAMERKFFRVIVRPTVSMS